MPEAGGEQAKVNRAIFDESLKLWQADAADLGRSDPAAWEKAAHFMKDMSLIQTDVKPGGPVHERVRQVSESANRRIAISAFMQPILEADALRVTFADPYRAQFLALDGLSLAVAQSEFLAIVGPSGCGKSTLLRLLSGLLLPISGTVRFEGQPLFAPRREIGFVFQKANLMPWRTVLGNIVLPLEIGGLPKQRCGNALAPRSRWWGWMASPTPIPGSSPAACSSAWRWPAR